MKLLLLSVVVLCLTGAQGRHFWQADEPSQHTEMGFWKLWDHIVDIYTDVFKNLKYEEIITKYHLKEKFDNAMGDAEKLEQVAEEYIEAIKKSFYEELEKDFPIFSKEVAPKLTEFDDKLEAAVSKMVRDAIPLGSHLVHEVKTHSHTFYDKVKKMLEHTHEQLTHDVEDLRKKVQPFAESVHAEYEKYREGVKEDLGGKVQQAKDDVEEEVKEIVESIAKLFGDLKTHLGPQAQNIHSKFEHVIKEIIKAFKEEEAAGEGKTEQQESS